MALLKKNTGHFGLSYDYFDTAQGSLAGGMVLLIEYRAIGLEHMAL